MCHFSGVKQIKAKPAAKAARQTKARGSTRKNHINEILKLSYRLHCHDRITALAVKQVLSPLVNNL